MERLQLICGVDREDLIDMIAEVRALTPKPGAGFGGGAVQSGGAGCLCAPGAGRHLAWLSSTPTPCRAC